MASRSLSLTVNELKQTDKCKSQMETQEAVRQMYTAGVRPGTDVFLCQQLKPLSLGCYGDVRARRGFAKHIDTEHTVVFVHTLDRHTVATNDVFVCLWHLNSCR